MTKIICAGLIAADIVFEIPEYPLEGSKNRASTSQMITGGGALNAASAIASLGGVASLFGAIGDDLFGAFLKQEMANRRIDDCYVQTILGAATSRSAIMISPNGDRTIVNHRDGVLVPDAIDLPEPFPFDGALVDTRLPESAARIVKAARRVGKPAVVDGEAPVAMAQEALSHASHIVFSEQGLADYSGGNDGAALKEVAKKLGCWCAVTRGNLPVLCYDGHELIEVPVYQANAINTLGAGDVWHGAFTLALAQNRSEIDAVRWANAAASLKVSHPIGGEGALNGDDVDALFEASF